MLTKVFIQVTPALSPNGEGVSGWTLNSYSYGLSLEDRFCKFDLR